MQKQELKVPVEVYSRVVGYCRPVNQWNKGKQEEFGHRCDLVFNSEAIEAQVGCCEYQRAV